MKKQFVTFFIGIFAAVIFLVSCRYGKGEPGGAVYRVFYLNREGTGLVQEDYTVQSDEKDTVGIIEELLKRLRTGEGGSEYTPPVESELEVTDFQIKETRLSVFFSAAYNNRSDIDEILCRAAIVKTLCQVPGVEYVEFYVEDQPLMLSGSAVGLMNAEYFVDDLNPNYTENSKWVTLYFADSSGQMLKEVNTEVVYSTVVPLEKLLLEKLIAGPGTLKDTDVSDLLPTVPLGTVVNSVTIRDNICYVDLGREFTVLENKVRSDVVIYSIVNTLCELPNVSKVQFSVNGEQQEVYGDTKDFNLPFERNLDLVRNGASE